MYIMETVVSSMLTLVTAISYFVVAIGFMG